MDGWGEREHVEERARPQLVKKLKDQMCFSYRGNEGKGRKTCGKGPKLDLKTRGMYT